MSDDPAGRLPRAASSEADLLFDAGRWADAAGRYRRVLESEPGDVHCLTFLAAARSMCGDDAGATEAIIDALGRAPQEASVLSNALFVGLRAGPTNPLFEDRRRLLAQLIEVDPEGERAGPRILFTMVSLGSLAEARREAEELLGRRGDDPEVLRAAAHVYLRSAGESSSSRATRRAHRRRATELLERAVRLDPLDASALAMLAEAARLSGRRVDGVEHLIAAVRAGDLTVADRLGTRSREVAIWSVWAVPVGTVVVGVLATMAVASDLVPPWVGAAVVWAAALLLGRGALAAAARMRRALPATAHVEVLRHRSAAAIVAGALTVAATSVLLSQGPSIWMSDRPDRDGSERCVVGTSIVTTPSAPTAPPTIPPGGGRAGIGPPSTVAPVEVPVLGPCPPGHHSAEERRIAARIEQLEHLTAPGFLLVGLVATVIAVATLRRLRSQPHRW
ncbi:tetratricopeptide repeat protein [Dermatobacter hominis]|uniref:tetratricopeptide repeat protein n=1 Tax=Dermatobacter hominis TaxID=2884263 RepID=UPI001D11C7BF|nr:hypothetical protein [Dermatobacter hominis]UDY35014.1 hypothetical protein LH044_16950 [Dermatobacter hominis]